MMCILNIGGSWRDSLKHKDIDGSLTKLRIKGQLDTWQKFLMNKDVLYVGCILAGLHALTKQLWDELEC